MCTVSIIPLPGGLRLVANRDELRKRAAALRPQFVTAGDLKAVMPVDVESAGTWVAANDAGLVFAVLNVNPGLGAAQEERSRGTVIPPLLGCSTLDQAVHAVNHTDYSSHRVFRLVVADRHAVAAFRSSSRVLECIPLERPVMFTSSGLGDAVVEGARMELFRRIIAGDGSAAAKQDRFHAHRWPSSPATSVVMSRPEAATVSRTTVEIGDGLVRMWYCTLPVPEEEIPSVARPV